MSEQTPTIYGSSELQKYNARLILTVVFRRRWVVLGVFLPIFLFGIWGTLSSTDSFTARSQVLVQARSIEAPEFRHLPVDNDVLMSTAVQVSQSIPVAEKAVEIIREDILRFKADFPSQFELVETEEDFRDLVLGGAGATQIGESNVVEILYSHENAEFAYLVVGALTDAFLEYSVESKQNKEALGYYSEQIDEIESDMEVMMAKRLDVFDQGGLSAFKENTSSGIQHMRALEYDYFQALSRRTGMEKRYQGIQAAIVADPHFVPAVTSGGENANLIGARQTFDDAVLELARTQLTYNDSSEFVSRQKKYVAEAEKLFVGTRNAFVRDLAIDLEIAISEENSLRQTLEVYREELRSYPSLERKLYSIDLEIDSKKDLLEALQLKRGEVRLKAFGDARISNITKLNKATVDFGIQGSKKIIYLMMVSFLGFVLSLVAGMVVDSFDHKIYDVQQAEKQLEIPVLGAISAVESPGSQT